MIVVNGTVFRGLTKLYNLENYAVTLINTARVVRDREQSSLELTGSRFIPRFHKFGSRCFKFYLFNYMTGSLFFVVKRNQMAPAPDRKIRHELKKLKKWFLEISLRFQK